MLSKVWTAFLLFGAAASVVAWGVALCHEKGIRPFAGAVRFVRKLSWGGRLALLPLFLALVAYGSTKYVGVVQGEGEGEGVGVGGESISNHVERVDRVDGGESYYLAQSPQSSQSGDLDNVANVVSVANPNSQSPIGNIGIGNWQHSHTGNISTLASLKEGDFARGFVLTGIGTNEMHDFSAPTNAVVCEDWLKFGAAKDWFYTAFNDWSFRFGTNDVEWLRIFSDGELNPFPSPNGTFFAPFKTTLGIVPEANWFRLADTDRPSCFWHAHTPSNTLL